MLRRELRNASSPLGVPNLTPLDQLKVQASNTLCEFCIQVLLRAFKKGWRVTVENPARSWMWAILAHYVRATANHAFIAWYGRLLAVDFDMCMRGGSCDKRARFLTSAAELAPLPAIATACANTKVGVPRKLRPSGLLTPKPRLSTLLFSVRGMPQPCA